MSSNDYYELISCEEYYHDDRTYHDFKEIDNFENIIECFFDYEANTIISKNTRSQYLEEFTPLDPTYRWANLEEIINEKICIGEIL